MKSSPIRTRWAAIGAAVAVSLGAGGIGIGQATTSSGEMPIYVPIEPCRLADTRPAPDTVGPRSTPIGANETYVLAAWGKCGMTTKPTGLSLNVTAVGATLPTFLTLFPAGSARPTASHLNPQPGQPPTPNAVNVDLDGAGEFSIYNKQGTVNVIIDVVGYFDHHHHDNRYYTETEVNDGFVSLKEDTFYYVPGSLLRIHFQDGPATVYFDDSSDAVVRKSGAPGYMRVVIPIPLPAELAGEWGELVNFRVSYRLDNANSYITHTWLNNTNNAGGHVELANSSTDRTSTTFSSYVVDCAHSGCQLGWVPNGNYLTVVLGLQFGGIGSAHDINIGGVLMRVSYDG